MKNLLPSPCTVSNLTLAISLKLLVYNTPLFHSEKDTQKFPDKTRTENFYKGQIMYILDRHSKLKKHNQKCVSTFRGNFFLYCSTWTKELITPWITFWFGSSPQRSLKNKANIYENAGIWWNSSIANWNKIRWKHFSVNSSGRIGKIEED